MSYIRKLIGRTDDALDGMEEHVAAELATYKPEVTPTKLGLLDTNIAAIQQLRDRLSNQELSLKDRITQLNEELRQVSVTISAYDLALGAMQANSITDSPAVFGKRSNDKLTGNDSGITHKHDNIASGSATVSPFVKPATATDSDDTNRS